VQQIFDGQELLLMPGGRNGDRHRGAGKAPMLCGRSEPDPRAHCGRGSLEKASSKFAGTVPLNPRARIAGMKIDLDEEEIQWIVRALEHYHAYLRAVQREDSGYKRLADKLKRLVLDE